MTYYNVRSTYVQRVPRFHAFEYVGVGDIKNLLDFLDQVGGTNEILSYRVHYDNIYTTGGAVYIEFKNGQIVSLVSEKFLVVDEEHNIEILDHKDFSKKYEKAS